MMGDDLYRRFRMGIDPACKQGDWTAYHYRSYGNAQAHKNRDYGDSLRNAYNSNPLQEEMKTPRKFTGKIYGKTPKQLADIIYDEYDKFIKHDHYFNLKLRMGLQAIVDIDKITDAVAQRLNLSAMNNILPLRSRVSGLVILNMGLGDV